MILVLGLLFSTPSKGQAVTDLTKIVLGKSHGCGITRTGALRCFGNNGVGQVGTDRQLAYSFARYSVPVLPNRVTDVAISDEHSCAVMSGVLFCWGSNEYGQLGIGDVGSFVKTPIKVAAVTGEVTAVAAGSGTTCVILAPRGALQCWGRNDYAQVGSGTDERNVLRPVTVFSSGVTDVAIGGQHACAVVDSGLQCWGFLSTKDEDFKTLRQPISIIPAGQGVTAVAAALHTCVVVKGALQCWGRNFHNQVGVKEGSRVAPREPVTIIHSGVSVLALSDENTCAVVNGQLMCWGWNNRGQLGIPISAGTPIPIVVYALDVSVRSIKTVAIGMGQVCVLTSAATVQENSLLQCSNRSSDSELADDNEVESHADKWIGFGTDGVMFAEQPLTLPRIARYGMWRGTIGTQSVTALLLPSKQSCDARYYYQSHLFAIALTEKDRRQGRVWKEMQGTVQEAIWTFEAGTPDSSILEGKWKSHDGKRHFPIRLELLALTPSKDGEDGKPVYNCDAHNKAFDAPRIAHARRGSTVVQRDAQFQGQDKLYRYREVSLLGQRIQSIAPAKNDEHKKLQNALNNWESESISQFYDCAFGASWNGGKGQLDFQRELTPHFWNSKMLVLRESYSSYCGGAYPSSGTSDFWIWDMNTDRRINIWTWIKGVEGPYHIVSKRLLKELAARYGARNDKGDGGCADALNGSEFFRVHPNVNGMVFSPSFSHAQQACEDDIEIPWEKMRPFLTSTGLLNMKAFIKTPSP